MKTTYAGFVSHIVLSATEPVTMYADEKREMTTEDFDKIDMACEELAYSAPGMKYRDEPILPIHLYVRWVEYAHVRSDPRVSNKQHVPLFNNVLYDMLMSAKVVKNYVARNSFGTILAVIEIVEMRA